MSPWQQALILAGALVVGLGISAALLIAAGVKPSALFDEFIVENFSDPENLHSILFQAAPLIFVGVSAALAFRVRFWNLGIEGQMIWGGIAATAVSFYDIGPPAHAIAVDDGVRGARRHGLDHRSALAARALARQRDHRRRCCSTTSR